MMQLRCSSGFSPEPGCPGFVGGQECFLTVKASAPQLRPFLEMSDLATVTHALVTSRLDYCNALYVGLPLKSVRKLQLVQRAAARLLTGAGYREHTTPLLKQLHWLPVHFWAQFKVLVMTYRALYSSASSVSMLEQA